MSLDAYAVAKAEAMIAGYHARWYGEPYEVIAVEAEFTAPLRNPETGASSRTYELAGKLDVLVRDRRDGRIFVVEHKSSSEDISIGSVYWRRLTLNGQISTYMVGARSLGVEPYGVLYDVLGKPDLRPRQVPIVDDDGVEIVLDAARQRVRTKDGKRWRRTGDAEAGYVLQTRQETAEEYGARVREAIVADPDRYYRRGVVVRLDSEERDAAYDAWITGVLIREGRLAERYPRNPDACVLYGSTCAYFDVCSGQEALDGPRFVTTDRVHAELTTDRARLPLITNSELGTYRACARKHHYRYDLLRRPVDDGTEATRLGTLLHLGLEAWWRAVQANAGETECLTRALEAMSRPAPARMMTAASAA
jgi:hypothetical protein